ncbi:hypothetical protein CIT292_10325 [Citrobacter youngae ATCC 29220]|uniref:Uncharacterized protein n=1 Tax=Citrobacter youngae ATCC 29220 TaxID=500640 RepID=D4BIG0_9ENTR|nr:hypothetical protein CIT292_10325 [Citrobacter youngae ATCC 29220]
MAAQAPYPAYNTVSSGRGWRYSSPTLDLHFIYKNCAPLPTDC